MRIDKQSDHHVHTAFSDGTAPIDEMVSVAIEKGLKAIAITDHMPLPFDNRYAVRANGIEEYRRQIRSAQRTYAGQIRVKMGLEFEYAPQFAEWIRRIAAMGWDQMMASVHHLFVDARPHMANGSLDQFNMLVRACNHDMETVCSRYYAAVQRAAQTGWFDIVGHLDVIKKHNATERFFSETSPWYRTLVMETLDTIKQSGMKIEINMAGINHPVGATYPSRWIIQEALKRDIQLVLGSDAHRPESIAHYFDALDDLVMSDFDPGSAKFLQTGDE